MERLIRALVAREENCGLCSVCSRVSRDSSSDDDYVDDSFLTKDDVANAEEDMKSLKDEISDDDITKPDYSRVTATTNQKDAKGAATNEEGAIGSAGEKSEATYKKDADVGENELQMISILVCRVWK